MTIQTLCQGLQYRYLFCVQHKFNSLIPEFSESFLCPVYKQQELKVNFVSVETSPFKPTDLQNREEIQGFN